SLTRGWSHPPSLATLRHDGASWWSRRGNDYNTIEIEPAARPDRNEDVHHDPNPVANLDDRGDPPDGLVHATGGQRIVRFERSFARDDRSAAASPRTNQAVGLASGAAQGPGERPLRAPR